MRISESLRTRKKKNNFNITDIKIYLKPDKWNCERISAVYYQGKRLKRHAASSRYVYKINDYIIKVETEYKHQTQNEINFYTKKGTKKNIHFPKLIAHDITRGIIVQEFIEFYNRKLNRADRKTIKTLVEQYGLESDVDPKDNYNWGINKATNQPVIFDMGFS